MLGILELDNNLKKIKSIDEKLLGYNAVRVKLPNEKLKNIKKARKILGERRIIVPDNWSEDKYLSYGFSVVSPGKIYKRLVDKIYVKTLSHFNASPSVMIHAGYMGNREFFVFDKIIKNSRSVAVSAPCLAKISEYALENYGISILNRMKDADITIGLYEKDFYLQTIKNGVLYTLRDMEIEIEGVELEIGKEYLKSLSVALLELGALGKKEINICALDFERKKLT